MLSSGNIQVYTSDDSPDKRQMVDEAELLLGDQVRLETAIKEAGAIPPKGFIRYVPGSSVLDVIAFGAADHVRIERYGDNGYNFRPGDISKLRHDPLFIFVLTHFLNHALGIFGVATMELVQLYRIAIWRSSIGTVLLYGAAIVHLVLVLKRIIGRRTWRMPMREALQIFNKCQP